jgi:hypothetical protein
VLGHYFCCFMQMYLVMVENKLKKNREKNYFFEKRDNGEQ